MQPSEIDLNTICIAGQFVSRKMDGIRVFWDGGITRGLYKSEVPWANIKNLKEDRKCTGLWTRYGNIIHAPDWWVDKLPLIALDGELWNPNLSFQTIVSATKTIIPDDNAWSLISFHCYDIVPMQNFCFARKLTNNNFRANLPDTLAWAKKRPFHTIDLSPFDLKYQNFSTWKEDDVFKITRHTQLVHNESEAREQLKFILEGIFQDNGEGIIIKPANLVWFPERSKKIIKYKFVQDSEAEIIGYMTGEETDKGSKLLGKMGSLIIKWKHPNTEYKELCISGFTDSERLFDTSEMTNWAKQNPGQRCPLWIENSLFRRGQIVNFKYRDLSDDGIPKEARYKR